jgi:hypothetical protein
MSGSSPAIEIVSAALNGLSINCYRPDPRARNAGTLPTLDAFSRINHQDALRVHGGDHQICMEQQKDWQAKSDADCEYVETKLSISDMVLCAAQPLVSQLVGQSCVAINCQSSRESGYGCATASRLLFETGSRGSSHTVSHCGATGFYMAMEHAILLANAENYERLLVSAADRWLDIYPRSLGKWVQLQDGAAVATAELSKGNSTTFSVFNKQTSGCNFMSVVATGLVEPQVVADVTQALKFLVESDPINAIMDIVLVSPSINPIFVESVECSLCSNTEFKFRSGTKPVLHFGCADPLVRLQDAAIDQSRWRPEQETVFLLWDFEPNGLLGAALVRSAAFDQSSLELAA